MTKVIVIGIAALMVPVVLIGAVTGAVGAQVNTNTSSLDIPTNMLMLYLQASAAFHIPAPILAGIGKVECDHDRNPACSHPNSAGAEGPMQFLPATFAVYEHASGSASPSIYDERDSVYAAAEMLSADGVSGNASGAIFAYNHSNDYVTSVLGWAQTYASLANPVQVVVATALSYLGVPYLYGGTTSAGIDCSGLVLRSFEAVGIEMPRVAQQQSEVGTVVPLVGEVQPGDLLAYGTSPDAVEHIAIATSSTHMVEAPHTGTFVREVPIRTDSLVVIRRVLS